jgi:hypothetical protein
VKKSDLPARHPVGPRKRKDAQPARPRLGLMKRIAEDLGLPYTSFRGCADRGEFKVYKIGRLDYVEYVEIYDRWLPSRVERAS